MLELLVIGLLGYIVQKHVTDMKRLGQEARTLGKKTA